LPLQEGAEIPRFVPAVASPTGQAMNNWQHP